LRPRIELTPQQSSSDIPLLTSAKALAQRHLGALLASSSRATTPTSGSFPVLPPASLPTGTEWRVGFITPPFKDTQIPVTDHLHAHAYVLPADRLGWWRGVAYSGVAWYELDDLVAEIRCARPPALAAQLTDRVQREHVEQPR
jgi:hypothetical protein